MAFDPSKINYWAFSYHKRLERLRLYVESHISEPIPLETASRIVCLEATYFSKYLEDWSVLSRLDPVFAGRESDEATRAEECDDQKSGIGMWFQDCSIPRACVQEHCRNVAPGLQTEGGDQGSAAWAPEEYNKT